MLSILIVIFVLSFGFILKILHDINKKKSQLPASLPCRFIFGNVTYLNKPHFYKEINKKYRKDFKDYLTLWFFNSPIIIVNDYRKLVDLYVNKYPIESAGRPEFKLIFLLMNGCKSISKSNIGPQWTFQRKLVHASLRKFAQNVQLDNYVRNSFKIFKEVLIKKSTESGAMNPYIDSYALAYNITSAIVFGKIFEIDDPDFIKLHEAIEYINDFFQKGIIYFLFPYSYYLPIPGIRKIKKYLKDLMDYLRVQVEEHENSKQYLDIPNDILDYILKEKEEYRLSNNPNIEYLNRDYVIHLLADVFFAGTDTTAVTTSWMIGLIATNPDVKRKVKHEVMDYEQRMNKEISVTDKTNLNYTQAVLNEILRYSSLAPFGVLHEVMKDIVYDGYTLRKGTQIMANQYEFHFDEAYWENPECFNPDRFIDEKGKLVAKKEGWLPFSCGRRVCVGESVAKADLFLILCLICKELDMEWCTEKSGSDVLKEKDDNSQARYTADYYIRFTESI